MHTNELALMGPSSSQIDVVKNTEDSPNAVLVNRTVEPEAFSWTTVTANIDLTDTAILITNLSTAKHLHIVRAYIWVDVHTAVDLNLPDYGTFTGTAVTGIPLNRRSISIAPALAYADETGNGNENTFARISTNELATGQQGQFIELDGKVKLGYRDSFSMDIVAESGAFYSMVIGYYHNN